ncbi:MAG TPA: hypothetical protein VL989_01515 [Candidatus Sulfotelmatobacter sp.]|nr:hypothetical protein [Candidatus Sulfotelmatobacter sp.]
MDRAKQIAKDSAMAAADSIASKIPGLDIAWGVSKAVYGSGLKLRQQKALEWVEMIRDNPGIFTEGLLSKESFQDSFVYALEKYITERNEQKRQYARNIFLHLAEAESIEDFPLERLYITLEQLSMNDIAVLSDIDPERTDINYQIYGATDQKLDNIYSLLQVGIIRESQGSHTIVDGFRAPFVNISNFGKEFTKYIKRDSSEDSSESDE